MSSLVETRRISDPVHGIIRLTELEARVISTRAFQRLRNVKQLGLAHMVYPGADYSRFSHSLGVCHVTQRMIASLKRAGARFDETPNEELTYRLAGLLHDVGHYPFSHAMEIAVQDHYSSRILENAGDVSTTTPKESWLPHEEVGKEVLRLDEEIQVILKAEGIKPEDIYRIFARENPGPKASVVSSDMDADRIDFLLRTARHTGIPYGNIDLDYMLSQLRIDGSGKICIDPKGIRTADHFLLGRYFDYQQVAFHKTVAALEWVLRDVLRALLEIGLLSCSEDDIVAKIRSNNWELFDDSFILNLIRELRATTHDNVLRAKADAILLRQPPKLVANVEFLDSRGGTADRIILSRRLIDGRIESWASEFEIPRELWHVWDKGLDFTKVGTSVPISSLAEGAGIIGMEPDRLAQAVLVLDPKTNTSTPIMNVNRSLMSLLADKALYALRVYVVLPEDSLKRAAIEAKIRNDLPEIHFI